MEPKIDRKLKKHLSEADANCAPIVRARNIPSRELVDLYRDAIKTYRTQDSSIRHVLGSYAHKLRERGLEQFIVKADSDQEVPKFEGLKKLWSEK